MAGWPPNPYVRDIESGAYERATEGLRQRRSFAGAVLVLGPAARTLPARASPRRP